MTTRAVIGAVLFAAIVDCVLVGAALAGRRDDRDIRQSLREQRRLDRDDSDRQKNSDRQNSRSEVRDTKSSAGRDDDTGGAKAATTGRASSDDRPAGPAEASKSQGSASGTGKSQSSNRGEAARGFKDEDGDGAPDTMADLFKFFGKSAVQKMPEAPAQRPAVRAEPAKDTSSGKGGKPPTAPSSQASAGAAPASAASPGGAAATAPGWSGKVTAAGQRAGSTLELPDLPVRRGELLAANLTPRVAERARNLGYVVTPAERLPNLGITLSRLILPPGADPAEALSILKTDAGSATLAFNSVYRPIRSATDEPGAKATPVLPGKGCASGKCYGPQTIKWQPELGSCARRVRVGVIDTGIDASHPTFRKRINIGNVQQGTQPVKGAAHGTGVLAVMAGDPESSTPGLIPEADFYAIDIFYADKNGAPVSDTAHLLRALDMLEAWDVKVVNLSLTGPRDDLVAAAVARLAQRNVLMVAAAGNDGPAGAPAYPAAYPEVIAVTAVNRDQKAYRLANHGDYIDVAAPGVDIWTALPNEKQGSLSGTSLATPFVASVVASLYPTLLQKTKAAALAQISYVDLGEPGRDRVYGNGLIVAPSSCRSPDVEVARAKKPPAAPASAPSFLPASVAGSGTRPAASGLGFAPVQ